MTAFVTGALKKRSALRLSWRRMKAEISGGVKVFCPSVMRRTSPGLQIFRQTKWKQLEFFANVFNAAAHETLYRVDGALGSLDQIFAGGIADDDLIALIEGDNRGDEVQSVLARDHDRALPLHESHQGVGGSEIDADDAIGGHKHSAISIQQSVKFLSAEC